MNSCLRKQQNVSLKEKIKEEATMKQKTTKKQEATMKHSFLRRLCYGVGGIAAIAIALGIFLLLSKAVEALVGFLQKGGFNLFSAVVTLIGVAVFWLFSILIEKVCRKLFKKSDEPKKSRHYNAEDEEAAAEEEYRRRSQQSS